MRALGWIGAAALFLGACNANPLLSTAASDYAPIRVGSAWSYASPDGTVSLQRTVTASGIYNGLDALTVASAVNGVPAGTSYLAFDGGALKQYDPALGWILFRQLPLVTNNKWPVPSGDPLVSITTVVDGFEDVVVPAGTFHRCYRLRTRTETYNAGSGVTSTAESLAWSAPDVGDVRYGSVAADGSDSITLMLTGYSIP